MHIDLYPAGFADEPRGLGAKLNLRRENVTTFGWLFVIGCLLAGGAAFLGIGRWTALLQLACFLGLGYLHGLMLRHGLALLHYAERWRYTLILVAVFLATQGAFVYFAEGYAWPDAAANLAAFLLPFCLSEGWRLFAELSLGQPVVWSPASDTAHQKATTFLNSMPVRFRVQLNLLDERMLQIAFRAPVRMKLGSIFFHAMQGQGEQTRSNGMAPIMSEGQKGWVFYTTGFLGGTRYLDPEAGLLENGVAENGIVKARRVGEAEPLEPE